MMKISPTTDPMDPPTEAETKEECSIIADLVSGITIAGVEDAYKAKSKLGRMVWIVVLLISFSIMVYFSYNIGCRYAQSSKTVFDDPYISGHLPPFPNVTFCVPFFGNQMREKLVISEKLRQRIIRAGYEIDIVIDFIANTHPMHFGEMEAKPSLKILVMKVLDEMWSSMLANGVDAMEAFIPANCPSILSNCAYNGQKFDCCSAAEILAINHGICWQISVSALPDISNGSGTQPSPAEDPTRIVSSGLTVDVRYDSETVVVDDSVITEGIIIHVGEQPSQTGSPVVIPSDTEAIIALAPAVNVAEITNCATPDQAPKLSFLSYYDPYAINCLSDQVIQNTMAEIGCSVPILSYVPDNETFCDANRIRMLFEVATGSWEKNEHNEIMKTKNEDKIAEMHKKAKRIYSGGGCPLHCQRWIYPIWSASYGYIRYSSWEDQRKRWSLSRIRVYFPVAAYREHKEEPVNTFYLAFCEMGGVWGVYLGFSIVTIMQILGYSWILFWEKVIQKHDVPNATTNS